MNRAKFIVPILSIVALCLLALVALGPSGLFRLDDDVPSVAAVGDSAEPDQAGDLLDPISAACISLEVPGLSGGGCFIVLDGLTSYNEVTEHLTVDEQGHEQIALTPGRLHYEPIVLTRAVPSDSALWEWRQQVIDDNMDDARRDGTITLLDQTASPIIQWDFVRGWPCRYEGPTFKASAPVLVETIEICHEGFSVAAVATD